MTKTTLPPGQRKRLLALIHLAKKQLSLSDDDYRALLQGVTGKSSSADMDISELNAVINAMEGRGFKVAPSKKLSPKSRDKPKKEVADKIRALWIEGFKCGAVRNRTETALNHWCHRMTRVDRVEWLTPQQANKLIEALKDMIERKNGTTRPE